jgi:signal transduction histidine kinase
MRNEDPSETTTDQDEVWARLADLSHKINNPLTSLLGRAQLLRQRAHGDPYVERAAEVIEECSRRIVDHLREISALVKEQRSDGRRTVARTPRSDAD